MPEKPELKRSVDDLQDIHELLARPRPAGIDGFEALKTQYVSVALKELDKEVLNNYESKKVDREEWDEKYLELRRELRMHGNVSALEAYEALSLAAEKLLDEDVLDFVQLIEHKQMQLAYAKLAFGEDSMETADTITLLSDIYLSAGAVDAAYDATQEALAIANCFAARRRSSSSNISNPDSFSKLASEHQSNRILSAKTNSASILTPAEVIGLCHCVSSAVLLEKNRLEQAQEQLHACYEASRCLADEDGNIQDTAGIAIKEELNFRACMLTARICIVRKDFANGQNLLRKALRLKEATASRDALEKGIVKLLLAMCQRAFILPRKKSKLWSSGNTLLERENIILDAVEAWNRLEDCFDGEGRERMHSGRVQRGRRTKIFEELVFGYAGFSQPGTTDKFVKKVAVWVVEIVAQMSPSRHATVACSSEGVMDISSIKTKDNAKEKRNDERSAAKRTENIRSNALRLMKTDEDRQLLRALFEHTLMLYDLIEQKF